MLGGVQDAYEYHGSASVCGGRREGGGTKRKKYLREVIGVA
jgi:hypothetical protein